MDLLGENSEYFTTFAIPVTILVIVLSMTYTMRNILRIWNAGKPDPDKQTVVEEKSGDDGTDDEADDEADENSSNENTKGPVIDPVQYCEHIQSQVKKARQRVATREIQQKLTTEEMEKEREVQRQQIEDIFKLMEQNSEKFGAPNEDDMVQQMRLYV